LAAGIAFAAVVKHSLAEPRINSIFGWDGVGCRSAWDKSDQCRGKPGISGGNSSLE